MGSEDRWRRRRRSWWFDIFDEFERMNQMIEDIIRRSFRFEPEEFFERPGEPGRPKVYTYGFSIKIGPDGKPVVREFGNVFPGRYGPEIRPEIEPLVDVMEKDDEIVVVAELPGVEKEQIDLHATEKVLTIDVDSPRRRYHKELELPAPVDPKSSKATYKNGVLEVRLKKVKPSAKGEKLKIE